MKKSCGIIPFRKNCGKLEFLVGHPGGDFWKKKDFWMLLKGCQDEEDGNDTKKTAIREFYEETGYVLTKQNINNMFYLGEVVQNKEKIVYAYGLYLPEIKPNECHSNLCEDGITPEIDKYAWMTYDEVISKTHPKHVVFYENILKTVGND